MTEYEELRADTALPDAAFRYRNTCMPASGNIIVTQRNRRIYLYLRIRRIENRFHLIGLSLSDCDSARNR